MVNKWMSCDRVEIANVKVYILITKMIILGLCMVIGLHFLGLWKELRIILGLIYIVTTPLLLKNQITEDLEFKKFMDISNYMEQILYAFRRHSKIAVALEDTLQIFPEGPMNIYLIYAIEHINESYTIGNTYEEALGMVEENYSCDMLERIHNFLISVELLGGKHEKGIDLLIQDSTNWGNRIMSIKSGKNIVKRNITIAVILAMLIVASTTYMVPSEFSDIQDQSIAQVAMLVTVLGNYLLWLFVQSKLTGSYIANHFSVSEEQIIGYRAKIGKYINFDRRKIYLFAFIFLFVEAVFLYTRNYVLVSLGLVLYVLIMTQKYRSHKLAIKKLRREVLKVFPDWLLGIALQLQTESVQVALEKSLDHAPYVLEEELGILVRNIEKDPLGISPYLKFYQELDLQELNSAMKMLYVMNQYGEEEMGQQIQTLVERNTVLQDASEKLKLEDYISGMGIVVLLPMLLGSGKMVIDMMLLVSELLLSTRGVM